MDPKTFTDVDFKFVDGQPDNQLLKGLKVWPVTEVSSASLIFALPCLALPCLALPCLALPLFPVDLTRRMCIRMYFVFQLLSFFFLTIFKSKRLQVKTQKKTFTTNINFQVFKFLFEIRL